LKGKTLLAIDSIFEAVFLIGFCIGFVIRQVYGFRNIKSKSIKKYKSMVEIILLGAAGVTMFLPFIFMFTPWLSFADYNFPQWLGWIGTALFAIALLLLWRSHADLGHNWSPIIQIKQQHTLVTDGVYRHIRHPMYAAHLLWATAQGLLLENWLAGWGFLVFFIPIYLIRAPKEERLMLEQFGDQYLQYISRTGRIIPRFSK
jgi:protein-S-isoprenylcysteine O-methyltransferase Ste14